MKKSLSIAQSLGLKNPVAYYSELAHCLGCNATTTLFLCQLLYWTDKSTDGWVFRTQGELKDETGLSIDEQNTARKSLRRKKLLEDKRKGYKGKLHYKIDIAQLKMKVDMWKTRMKEDGKPDSGNPRDQNQGIPETGIGESQELIKETISESREEKIKKRESQPTSSEEPRESGGNGSTMTDVDVEDFYKKTFPDMWKTAMECDRDYLVRQRGYPEPKLDIHIENVLSKLPSQLLETYRVFIIYSRAYRERYGRLPERPANLLDKPVPQPLREHTTAMVDDFLDDDSQSPVWGFLKSTYPDAWYADNQERLEFDRKEKEELQVTLERIKMAIHTAGLLMRNGYSPSNPELIKNTARQALADYRADKIAHYDFRERIIRLKDEQKREDDLHIEKAEGLLGTLPGCTREIRSWLLNFTDDYLPRVEFCTNVNSYVSLVGLRKWREIARGR